MPQAGSPPRLRRRELGQRGAADAVGMTQQRDEEAADDDGVGDGVDVLEQTRRDRPVVDARQLVDALEALVVPDVPLVERDVDDVIGALARLDVVDGGDDGAGTGIGIETS